ncbi:MAG: hypothetical protein LBH91_06585 [Prevotellaceae bacterium]|nr:hypothetical protein [Prevotellaceae bacterium]
MEWFINLEGDKTKLNWYLMELAMDYYTIAMKKPELEDYRSQYDGLHIARYCTYYARRMKKSFLSCLRGRTKRIIFYEEFITDFYPHHNGGLNDMLNRLAIEAFEEMQLNCEGCPHICLRDYRGYMPMFDKNKD